MGDFLDDTNLSKLECVSPQATSTVLSETRRPHSLQPEVSDLARVLFEDTSSEESLRLLKGNYSDVSILSHSFGERGDTGAGDVEDRGAMGSQDSSNSYLRERFDVSENDLHLQKSLEVEENFMDVAAKKIAEDEKEFEKEHFLNIPQQGSFSDSKFSDSLEATNITDLSRPSWWSDGAGDNRISGHSPLFPGLVEADESEARGTNSASMTSSIQDLVHEELGLGKKAACNGKQTNKPPESIKACKLSVSEIDRALEDVSLNDSNQLVEKLIGAARQYIKGPAQQQSSSNSSKAKQEEDGCFKRPLAAARRTRPSQPLTPTSSAQRIQLSDKSSTSVLSSSSSSRIASSRTAQSPRNSKSRLPSKHKGVPSAHASDQTTVGKSVPKGLQKAPASPHHRPHTVHRHVDSIEMPRQMSRLSSLSSPDLRSSKSRGSDQQSVIQLNSCQSDESLISPEKDTVAEREKGAERRNTGSTGRSRGASSGSFGGSTSKFLTASSFGQSPTHLLANSEGRSGPAPLGLLMPMGFVQCPVVNLGKVCAGAQQAVTIMLLNPTAKTECYKLDQSSALVGGQAPGQHETLTAEFPHRHIVCAGCVSEVQGFFVSTCPGAVEIDVSIAVEDKTGNLTKNVHKLTLSAQVEHPHLSVEPSQGLNFEGLHFDAEQGDSSRCSRELTVVNESSCPVPVSVSVRGGNSVFSLRLKDATTHKLGQAATMLHVILPSKMERAATQLLVECSTKDAECLAINAEIEIEVNGCLLFRKILATVGLSASIVAPSLSLEGISNDEPIEVGDGKGQATVLSLQNDGPCSLELELSAGPLFRVSPRNARIRAKGSVELFIRARESASSRAIPHATTSSSTLEAVLVPQGFKVALARLVSPSQQRIKEDTTVSTVAASRSGGGSSDRSVRTLESNRRVLLWTGMHASSSVSKCLTLRNPNSSPVSVELELAGQYSKQFRARFAGARDSKGTSTSTQLEAGETVEVKVTHSSRASPAAAAAAEEAARFIHLKLIIKSRCGRAVDTKSVALYAFSGMLRVDVHDTLLLGPHRHLVDMGPLLSEGSTVIRNVTLFNGGEWDACVHFATPGSIFLSNSPETAKEAGYGELSVSPSCMVLRRKQTKVVTLTYQFGATSSQLFGEDQIKTVANMRVLYGFEALRQAAKRSFAKAGGKRQPCKELQPFLGAFEDEGQIDALPVPGNLTEEVFLKTVSQAAAAIIVSTEGAATLLQASTSSCSFAPLEDPTLLGRLSWLDMPE
ncbi:uncharacterized protein LOC144093615 isoform X3 [Amblyomma americanum]